MQLPTFFYNYFKYFKINNYLIVLNDFFDFMDMD